MHKTLIAAMAMFAAMTFGPAAQASFRNYQPTAGAPWVAGGSSFDWTNWSYSDGVLTNNAGSNRTWTVPFTVDNAMSGVAVSTFAEMKVATAGQGITTGQAVVLDSNGVRTFSGSVIAPSCGGGGTFCDTSLSSVTYPFEGTVYINFVVGSSGGQFARSQINQ